MEAAGEKAIDAGVEVRNKIKDRRAMVK